MESHALTAAGRPIHLEVDGKELELLGVPFTDRNYDDLNLWVQSQVLAIARKALRLQQDEATDDDPIDFVYDDEMEVAVKAAAAVSLYEPSGMRIVNTPKGTARILWLMCRKNKPDLEYNSCVGYARDELNRGEILRAFAKLNPREAKTIDNGTEPEDPKVAVGTAKNDE